MERREKVKWLNNYLIPYYNSHLYIAFSLWLTYTLLTVGHEYIASLMVVSAVIKLLGIYADRPTLRLFGLVGLNIVWGVGFYQSLIGQHPAVALPYHFPAFVLLFGIGISLRGGLVAGENIIVAIVTAVGTYFATRVKAKHDEKEGEAIGENLEEIVGVEEEIIEEEQ